MQASGVAPVSGTTTRDLFVQKAEELLGEVDDLRHQLGQLHESECDGIRWWAVSRCLTQARQMVKGAAAHATYDPVVANEVQP